MYLVGDLLEDSPADQIPLMRSTRKVFYTAALSRLRELTEGLLKRGLDASSPFSAMKSVRKVILRSPEWAEAWSLFLRTRLGMATPSTSLFVKAKGAIKRMPFTRAKHFSSTRSFSAHLKLTDLVRFLVRSSCFGSVKPHKLSDKEPSGHTEMTCGLCMDVDATGKVRSKIKFLWQPGGNGLEMSTRKCCCHYFMVDCLPWSAELRNKARNPWWIASFT
jgi:hypothetical protein